METLYAVFFFSIVIAASAGTPCTSVTCRSTAPAPTIPNATENDTIRSIQCTLRCMQTYGLTSELSVSIRGWLLYSSLLTNRLDCSTFQKLRECKRGCVLSDSFQSPDDCRDQCYTSCQSECGGASSCLVQGLPCEQQCRKPLCKQGCEEFNWTASLDPALTPLTSPDVKTNSSMCGLYTLNITRALPAPRAGVMGGVVGIAINAVGCGKNLFFWQANVEDILDLRSFVCTTPSISFALVTKYTRSKWSPPLQLCFQAVQVYPSQVPASSIKVRYYEDPRPTFTGYSVADITWTPASGFESLASYTIQLLSQQSECGGSNVLYSYNNIYKGLTEFIIQARTANGLLKFGCNYYLIFTANPIASGRSGTYLTIAPQLSGPPPQMVMVCQKVWDASGEYFNITISISIANATSSIFESISGFTVSSELVQVRSSDFVPVLMEAYDTLTLQAKPSLDGYGLQLYGFKPKSGLQVFYRIEVEPVQNSAFLWRSVPGPEVCYVESSGLPPMPIRAFHVHSVQYSSVRAQAVFSWNPPAAANGALEGYELCITTQFGAVAAQQSNACALTIKTAVNQTSLSMVGSLQSTDDPLCLYALVRSFNQYAMSDWSQETLISNNQQCDSGSGLQAAGAEDFVYEAAILIY
ncbi:hypothetical protein EMCRGX_G013617 [Ephydatia muelleri]